MKQESKSYLSLGARWVLAPLSMAVLAACGGSSGDDPPPGPVTEYIVDGQVAVGALVDGAAVEITCAEGGGTGRAISGSNGSFELNLEEGSVRPCVGEAILESGNRMRSIIPGGDPNVTRINFSPLTDALVTFMMGQTNKGSDANPRDLIQDESNLFSQAANSRAGFNNSRNSFQAYFETNTGISLAGFDYLTDTIVVGQPSDNALEAMRGVLVPSNPDDPNSPPVPLLNPDGSVSTAGRATINSDAPEIVGGDIPGCDAPGNSCGGTAGQEVVITGGGGN